jgi:hypothetical protein
MQQLQRGLRVSRWRRNERNSRAVCCWHVQPRRLVCVQQLQCGVCVRRWLNDAVAGCWHVSGWSLQCRWRDVVQQLQRRVRVPGRLQQLNTRGAHV